MASAVYESEHELEHLFEGEGEGEFEFEHEHEGEQFWSQLAGLARRGLQSPTLRTIARGAAKGALSSLDGLFDGEGEGEGEFFNEHEHEHEHELNPVKKVYLDAMLEMEHMASAAASAEHEHEAEQFLPALIPLAARLAPMALRSLPKIARALPQLNRTIARVAPQLTRSVTQVGRILHRTPGTRRLIQVLPRAVRLTMGQIARRAAQGAPITPAAAKRVLASNVYRVVRSPRAVVRAANLSRRADRHYHRLVAAGRSPAVSLARTIPGFTVPGGSINGVSTIGTIGTLTGQMPGAPHPGSWWNGGSSSNVQMNCRCTPAPRCHCGR